MSNCSQSSFSSLVVKRSWNMKCLGLSSFTWLDISNPSTIVFLFKIIENLNDLTYLLCRSAFEESASEDWLKIEFQITKIWPLEIRCLKLVKRRWLDLLIYFNHRVDLITTSPSAQTDQNSKFGWLWNLRIHASHKSSTRVQFRWKQLFRVLAKWIKFGCGFGGFECKMV